MIKQMQFPVKCAKRQFNLELSSKHLRLRNDEQLITFPISLNLIIAWQFYGDKIVGCKVENLSIEGEYNDMKNLKQNLGASVTFTGISLFYSLKKTIYVNKDYTTKVSQLTSNKNNSVYACKSYKKCNRSLTQIHNEIKILLRLQGLSFVPIIYEVYESSKCVYLIMEYFQKGFDQEFTDEEVKIVTYNLLQAVQTLENHSVAHKNIKRSHIMFDEDNALKILGFGNAVCDKISNHEFELDIFQIGMSLYKLQQKYYNQLNKQSYCYNIRRNYRRRKNCPIFPIMEQTSFVLYSINNSNSALTLNQPYLTLTLSHQGERESREVPIVIIQEIQSMNPKFKKQIEDLDQTDYNLKLISPSNKHLFLEDQSTYLQN